MSYTKRKPKLYTKTSISPGQRVEKVMPYSEVCMHMKVAGNLMLVELLPNNFMCQLYRLDGTPFSFPITHGEAGIYSNSDGTYYYYPNLG